MIALFVERIVDEVEDDKEEEDGSVFFIFPLFVVIILEGEPEVPRNGKEFTIRRSL